MWFLSFALQVAFGLPVAFGAVIEQSSTKGAQEYYNHAQVFAGTQSIVRDPIPMTSQGQKNGNFVLLNQCNYDIYMWEAWEAHQGDPIKVLARSAFRKELISGYLLPKNHNCIDNCGVAYKITKRPQLIAGTGGNQMQFEYTTKLGVLYFDISFVDCAKNLGYHTGDANNCPSWLEGIRIDGQKPPHSYACETVECLPGEMCIHDGSGAYYIDKPQPKWNLKDPVKTCPTFKSEMELYFRTCTQNPDL